MYGDPQTLVVHLFTSALNGLRKGFCCVSFCLPYLIDFHELLCVLCWYLKHFASFPLISRLLNFWSTMAGHGWGSKRLYGNRETLIPSSSTSTILCSGSVLLLWLWICLNERRPMMLLDVPTQCAYSDITNIHCIINFHKLPYLLNACVVRLT